MIKTIFDGAILALGTIGLAAAASTATSAGPGGNFRVSGQDGLNRIALYKRALVESIGAVTATDCANLNGERRSAVVLNAEGKITAGSNIRDLFAPKVMLGITRTADEGGGSTTSVVGGAMGEFAEKGFVSNVNWIYILAGDATGSTVISSARGGDTYCQRSQGLKAERQFVLRLLPLFQVGAGPLTCLGGVVRRVRVEPDGVWVGDRYFSLTEAVKQESLVINPVLNHMRYWIQYENGNQFRMILNQLGTLTSVGELVDGAVPLACGS